MAVVKADGYGHGLERVAKILAAADALAVARVEEAVVLRRSQPQGTVVVLGGVTDKEQLQLAAAYHLTLVVHEVTQLDLLRQAPVTATFPVWLKVDTGMHRLGFPPAVVPEVLASLRHCPAVTSVIGLMTHLANADLIRNPLTAMQIKAFKSLPRADLVRSMANSAAIMAYPEAHFDWVRPGIMLYGASPFSDCTGASMDLQPVMTLETRLIAIHHLRAGDSVGYGATWICPEDMMVGVAAIGYGDGYPRHARSGTPVLVNGYLVPLVGRVSMDTLSVDLRSQPKAKVGDPVVAWGPGLPVEEVSTYATTIPYELLCQVTSRVLRISE